MYTIFDYLKYYKDYSLSELKWNNMDNLFIAIISYASIKSFNYKSYNAFVFEVLNHSDKTCKDVMAPKVLELLEIVKESKRYENMKFMNFINQVDTNTQFGAITVSLDDLKIISFKGSDGSVIGWLENFRLSYIYPTFTQRLAIDYLNKNIGLFDSNVYVTGHSKGGNLALVSSMELSNFKYKKINSIINFDGPGVKYNEFKSLKYKRLKGKLINIIPTGSYIGTLLFNENYKVIKSNAHAINEHYPTTWSIFGNEFVKGNLSKLSTQLIKMSSVNIKNLDDKKMSEIFENAFKVFDKRETTHIKMTLIDIVNIVRNVSKLDPELSKYITTIITTMIKLSKENK